MNKERHKRICPIEMAGGLDNSFRRLLQNPGKILEPYIQEGMTVLDLGCGPGFFTSEMAKMVSDSGRVIAADLQEGMLELVKKKIKGTELEKRIILHQCHEENIGITENVDFILAFYMIHEVPDQPKLLTEMKSLLKPGGKILIIEPKFHVSKKAFEKMVDKIKEIGFGIVDRPKIFISRAVLLTTGNNQTNGK